MPVPLPASDAVRDNIRGGLDLRRSEQDDNFDLDAKFAEAQRRSAAKAEVARQHAAATEEHEKVTVVRTPNPIPATINTFWHAAKVKTF